MLTTSLTIMSLLSRKYGTFEVSLPYGPRRPVRGIALPFFIGESICLLLWELLKMPVNMHCSSSLDKDDVFTINSMPISRCAFHAHCRYS
jgi:hypothetical protein